MLSTNSQHLSAKWTWADLVSSYRFWGIFLFFIACCIVDQIQSFLPILLRQTDFSLKEIGIITTFKTSGYFIGFIVAWLALRQRKIYAFYLTGACYLIAIICLSTGLTQVKHALILTGVLLLSIASGVLLFLIPALLADAVKDGEVFIVTAGAILLIKFFSLPMVIITLLSQLVSAEIITFSSIFGWFAVIIVIGVLLLIPVKTCLFNEAPRIREVQALPPQQRHPVAVFLLFFVPFYFIYWCASIHREMRTYSQSPTLLTPFAAGWCSFLVPLGFPMILATLNDIMRSICHDKGQQPSYKTGLIIFLSLFLPPLGLALVQAQFNQLQQLPQEQE